MFLDDDALLERGRRLRGQGEIPGRKYIHDTLAYNYRLTEIAAAIGRAQIARADEVLGRRAALVARYHERLADVDGVVFAGHHELATPSWFSLAILIPARDAVAASLAEAGIETRSLYPIPTYRQPIPEYAPWNHLDLPVRGAGLESGAEPAALLRDDARRGRRGVRRDHRRAGTRPDAGAKRLT